MRTAAAASGQALVAWRDEGSAMVYSAAFTVTSALGVDTRTPASDVAFAAPVPDPARRATTVRFQLARAIRLAIAAHDAAGRRVGDGIYWLAIAGDGVRAVRRIAVVR